MRLIPSRKIFYIILPVLAIALGILHVFLNPFSQKTAYVQVCEENDTACPEKNLPYQNPKLVPDARVADLLSRMTLAEKIGQMALIEKNSIIDKTDIAKYGLGGLMSGGGIKPQDNTPAGWLEMVNNFQAYSRKTRLAIPLFYGVDANHGHGNIPGATLFPHQIGLGAGNNPELVKKIGEAVADELAATGINWVYSPNLDIAQDTRWGRTYETFGSDPHRAGVLGAAYIEGLQNISPSSFSVAAAAKHYIGNGSTNWGSSINKKFFIDQGNSTVTENELRRIHLEPFTYAIQSGAKSIMVGLNKWNGEKVVFNKHLVTDVLKGELRFQGFVVSDWYGVYEKEPSTYRALVKAVNAGIDMVMLPYDYKSFSENMQRAVATGEISQERIDDAVRRILKAKFETGLFDYPAYADGTLQAFGSAEHRAVARQAVQESLVVLKNNNAVPVSKTTSTVLVAGSAADNLGKQMGGWTVEWQGIDGNWVPGTTILQGIQKTVSPSTQVKYNLEGDFKDVPRLADIGIAVVGESPYAEGWGDKEHPVLDAKDLQAISNLKKHSKKIVVVIISGRPLDIKPYLSDWDAVIAAWLPGSEGQGVADVLFGDAPFKGILPVSWN